MENQSFKKSLFGGFNRKDVLNCVDELSAAHKKEMDDLEAEKAKIVEEKSNIEGLLKTAQDSIAEKDAQIERLQQLVKSQNVDNDRLKQLNISVERKSKEVMARNLQLEKDLTALKKQLEEANQRLDTIDASGFTAEQLVEEANNRSTAALAEANNKASAILTQAAKKAADSVEQANRKAEDILSKANEEVSAIRNQTQEYNQQVKKRMGEMAAEISEKEKKASIHASELIRDAQVKSEEILKAAKQKLKDADAQYEKFLQEVKDVRLSALKILKEAEVKIDHLGSNMPSSLDVDEVFPQEKEAPKQAEPATQSQTEKTNFFR